MLRYLTIKSWMMIKGGMTIILPHRKYFPSQQCFLCLSCLFLYYHNALYILLRSYTTLLGDCDSKPSPCILLSKDVTKPSYYKQDQESTYQNRQEQNQQTFVIQLLKFVYKLIFHPSSLRKMHLIYLLAHSILLTLLKIE